MIKCVDLFCGCGGLSLGFQQAGFDLVAAFDNWGKAINVYNENFLDHKAIMHDLSNIELTTDILKNIAPDIIIGGPPCQDFSSAGNRNESFGRAELTINFAEIICNIMPGFFLMENVDRIIKTETLHAARKYFINHGYYVHEVLLDASYFNVPQKRKRFFMFGNKYKDLSQQINIEIEKLKSTYPTTLKDYFDDALGITHYYRHPRSYNRRGIFTINEPSPTIRGVNRPIPEGYKLHPGDNISLEQFKTVRALTTKERSMIQTFPTTFIFNDSKTHIEQMIGNAVPVNLANVVGTVYIKLILDIVNDI